MAKKEKKRSFFGMIKILSSSVKGYVFPTVMSPVSISIEVVMEVLIPTLMAKLIDSGIQAGDMGEVLKIGGLLVIMCIISLSGGVFSAKFGAEASCGFAKNLRRRMYYHIQDYSFSNIDKFSTASLVTRLTTDVNNVQMSFQMLIRIAVRAPLMFIFALVMAFRINALLSLTFVIFLPLLIFGLAMIMKFAHPIFEKTFKTYDRLNNVVGENLHGIRVVKSYVREEHETKKFNNVSNDIYKGFSKAEKILAFNSPLMQFCMYACTLIISFFGAKLIIETGGVGDFQVGNLQSLLTYSTQILMSLMMLSMTFVMITMSRASAERICEVLEEQSDIINPENPVYDVKDGSIIFENVDFSYAKNSAKKCLDNINITINSGECIGVIGGTGSSKSTLVQLIPRLYDAGGGRVLVGGVDVKDYDIHALRNAVAMVLQKNELFAGTISDNLRWGDENASDDEIIRASRLAQAHSFVADFEDGYDKLVEQGGTNVSGGQKQRLCIARALLKKPKILILDDSTSAVDTKTDALIQSAFREELPDTTKIIIAQRISSVEHADKIIVLDDGKINGFGTHAELLENNAIYREVYQSQNRADEKEGA